MKISSRVARARESGTARIARIARELEAAGRPILKLNVGEPDFETPDFVKAAAIRAMRDGKTRYTDVAGTRELREAVAEKFCTENSIDCQPDRVIVGTGAKQLIFNALMATLDQADEVIITAPYWVSYPDMVLIADGTPKIIPCGADTGYKVTPDRLAAAIGRKTRWLIINSPGNPAGGVYSASELAALADVLRRHRQVAIVCDDIYEKIVFDGAEFATMAGIAPDLGDRTLTVNGVSKSMAMTGWRIGYATGPRPLIAAMTKLQGQSTTNASSIGQAAALAALLEPEQAQRFIGECLAAYEQRRRLVAASLAQSGRLEPVLPEGAFYHFVGCAGLLGRKTPAGSELANDADVCEYFLDRAGVSLVPGSEFGSPGNFRLSFAAAGEVLTEACAKMVDAAAAIG